MYASHFSLENIPFGIASSQDHPKRTVVTRLRDSAIFLDELATFSSPPLSEETIRTFAKDTVNDFAALPKIEQSATRKWIQSILAKDLENLPPLCISQINAATLYLPLSVADFTDFSCSRDHVLNAGEAVFGKRELPPGFEHFPVGYHGRTSSIVVSGTPIIRPQGQYRAASGKVVFGATNRLDYEIEVAAVIGKPSQLGKPVAIGDADDHIFGLVLLNDWSARDIQGLEMNPLGPLHGKSFATSLSPWIITLEALAPFRTASPLRNPAIELPAYLQDPDLKPTFDFDLEATIQFPGVAEPSSICKTSFSSIYWTLRDLVAQQTINGCSLRTGDLLATGTISGSTFESHGCLMEIAAKGGVRLMGAKGETGRRVFLENGDTVALTATAGEGVGFGECVGTIKQAVGLQENKMIKRLPAAGVAFFWLDKMTGINKAGILS